MTIRNVTVSLANSFDCLLVVKTAEFTHTKHKYLNSELKVNVYPYNAKREIHFSLNDRISIYFSLKSGREKIVLKLLLVII